MGESLLQLLQYVTFIHILIYPMSALCERSSCGIERGCWKQVILIVPTYYNRLQSPYFVTISLILIYYQCLYMPETSSWGVESLSKVLAQESSGTRHAIDLEYQLFCQQVALQVSMQYWPITVSDFLLLVTADAAQSGNVSLYLRWKIDTYEQRYLAIISNSYMYSMCYVDWYSQPARWTAFCLIGLQQDLTSWRGNN